ncbi:hypothetical protein ACHAXH_003839 [Discostella pseudostelligera]
MLKKLFAAHDVEDLELPSLDISDTSTSVVDASAREESSSSSDDSGYRPRRKYSYCDGAVDDDEQSIDYGRGRRRRGQSYHRSEAVDADGLIDLSTRSDGRGFSRRNSRSWSPPARSAKAPRSRSSQARFSYTSRRSSLGETTIYRTPYMASLDAYLNTTSGLRLQTDGKCTFSFERRRFAIRCAAPEDGGDGDYTFYLCIGPMKELQVKVRSKNLVKLIASWNEELKQRCLRRERERRRNQDNSKGDIPSSGLLQIDSTKPGDANVAFVYYGHVDDIKNAAHFQSTLDDFVDDALYLFDRINNDREPEVVKTRNNDRNHQHMTRSLPSFHTEIDYNDRPKLHRGNYSSRRQSTSVCKSSTTTTTFSESNDVSGNENDMENSSKSIFSRMISTWRSRSGEISFSPFIGLGNQEQDCYVVDRQAIEAGNAKPTIVLSRVGAGGGGSEKAEDASGGTEERQLTIRRANDYRRRDCSRPRTRSDCERPRQRRSITFDSDDDDRDSPCYEAPPTARARRNTSGADDSSCRRQSTRQITSARPHRKSTVFIADDFSDRQQLARSRRPT